MATNTQTNKPATARPSRTRATKAAPAKQPPAAVKATPPAEAVDATTEAPAVESTTKEPIRLVLDHTGTTKRYEVFAPNAEAEAAGIVGKLYLPLGTKVVKVLATE
jgi:hypothetical protein